MAGNTFGTAFRLTTFGESHGEAIGGILDGCPAGLVLDEKAIQTELDRRKPGTSRLVTARKESDTIHILSGVFEGRTTGAPIGLLIQNTDAKSKDYDSIKDLFRPGHGDYTFFAKYGHRDWRGGGRQSSRETAIRVAGGAIAKQLLAQSGIAIQAYLIRVGNVRLGDAPRDFTYLEQSPVRCPNETISKQMEAEIEAARAESDTLGGIIEGVVRGVPAGLGEPVFDKLDADLAKAILSIGATKGIEFGTGFAAAALRGSEHNDPMHMEKSARGAQPTVAFDSNHAGGILGGISNGNEIVLRTIVKPVSSIGKQQHTISHELKDANIIVEGRHDPCYAIRAVAVVEAMIALTLADHLLRAKLSKL